MDRPSTHPPFPLPFFLSLALAAVSGPSAQGLTRRLAYPASPVYEMKSVALFDKDKGVMVGAKGSIVRTADDGRTWTPVYHDLTEDRLDAVAFADAATGVAVADGGVLLRTTDGGITWSRIANGTVRFWEPKIAFASAQVGVIVDRTGQIARTEDAGATWTLIAGSGGISSGLIFTDLAFADSLTGVAVGRYGVIMRTADGGRNWTRVGTAKQGSEFGTVAFSGAREGVAMGGYQGCVWKTRDAGLTWDSLPNPNAGEFYLDAAFFDSLNGIAASIYGKIFFTRDGGATWARSTHAFESDLRGFNAVAVSGAGAAIAVGREGLVLRSEDKGATFSRAEGVYGIQDQWFSIDFAADGKTGLAVGWEPHLLRTEDGGLSWTRVPTVKNALWQGVAFAGGRVAAATSWDGEIFRSEDAGLSWKKVDSTRDAQPRLNGVDFGDSLTGCVAGYNGIMIHTVDGGRTWSRSATKAMTGQPYSIAFATPKTACAVGTLADIIRTEDGGATWTKVAYAGQSGQLNAVAFATETLGMAVGADGMVLRTDDAGKSWRKVAVPKKGYFQAVGFLDARRILIGGDSSLMSVDGGSTWKALTTASMGLGPFNGIAFAGDGAASILVSGMVFRVTDMPPAGLAGREFLRGPTSYPPKPGMGGSWRGVDPLGRRKAGTEWPFGRAWFGIP